MGNRYGKISLIPKDYSGAGPSQEKSLRDAGYARAPGTYAFFTPYRDTDKKYRTGIDENALYIRQIRDEKLRKLEYDKIKAKREDLELRVGFSLVPTSDFWRKDPFTGEERLLVVKMGNDDKVWDLEDAYQEIEFSWMAARPNVASSLEAYERGEVPSDTEYYVNNEDYENAVAYRKNKNLGDALVKLTGLPIEKRKKIGAFTEDTREEVVYNELMDLLKRTEIPKGTYSRRAPIDVFNMFVALGDDSLDVQSLVDQAFKHQIYREKKGGKVYEGEAFQFNSKEELIAHLLDTENQNDRLILEKKLKTKKLAAL